MTDEGGTVGMGVPTGRGHDVRGCRDDRASDLHAQPKVLAAAIEYAGRGWPVLPLHGMVAGRCTCGRDCGRDAGKHPIGAAVPRGVHDATRDRDVIARWWRRWPTANGGIATGNVLVIDVDPRHGGDETLARLERQLGALPETPTVETGGSGWHLYFRGVVGPLRATLGAGVDVKHHGGYVVAPPSVHASGRRYAWRTGCAPAERALAELPGAWLTAARRAPAPAPVVGHRPGADRVRRARAYVARMPVAVAGQGGHRALWLVTLALVRGFALDAEHALPILRDYSARCLPPWSERELAHKLADAMRADAPRGWLLGQEVRRVA